MTKSNGLVWAIVDENGRVIERFRHKQTALYFLNKKYKIYRAEVIYLEEE